MASALSSRRESVVEPENPSDEDDIAEEADSINVTEETPEPNKRKRRRKKLRFSNARQKKPKTELTDSPGPAATGSAVTDSTGSRSAKRRLIKDESSDRISSLTADASSHNASPKPNSAQIVLSKLLDYSPFQLLLDQLLRILQLKDTEQYFHTPISDDIAEGYSEIISTPMDFMTVREKINAKLYKTMSPFRNDIFLIFTNAIKYNEPDTVYYRAATRLLSMSQQLFSQAKLRELAKALPFMKHISERQLEFSLSQPVQQINVPKKPKSSRHLDHLTEEVGAAVILAQAKQASELAAQRLAARKPNSSIGFLRQNPDGSTTLNFFNGCGADQHENHKQVLLKDIVDPLNEGCCGISLFTEEKRNLVSPVVPLDYGPFATFAPRYDSTWATLTEEDSRLLLSTYGDDVASQYAQSLQAYVKDSGDYLVELVDGVLDSLTDGAHSRAFGSPKVQEISDSIDFDSLKSLSALGINMSFLDKLESQLNTEHRTVDAMGQSADLSTTENQLKQTSKSLEELAKSQYRRLSEKPPFVLTQVLEQLPEQELTEAKNTVRQLAQVISQLPVGQLVETVSVRKLMGVDAPVYEQTVERGHSSGDIIDMDILREFLNVDGP